MDTTVNSKKMREKAAEMSEVVHTLNSNIQKLVSAVKEAQSLKDTALKYDGQELDGEKKVNYTGTEGQHKITTRYYAHVHNSEGGTASSGMRSITGATKEAAFQQITKILDFTDSDLPAVADCIEQGIEEIETTLAKNTHDKDNKEDVIDTNNNNAENNDNDTNNEENNDNTGNDEYYPPNSTGSRSRSGGGGLPSGPSYRKPSDTKTTSSFKASEMKSNLASMKDSFKQGTKANSTILFSNNSSTTPYTTPNTVTAPNTVSTPTSPTTPTEPTTGTDSDNPTASAVINTGGSGGSGVSHTGVSSNPENPTDTPIEILGEDPPVPTKEMEDIDSLGDSIISGVSRVLPETGKGGKVQQGSALIPGVAGLGAAAAAGLGSKALLDKTNDDVDTFSNDEEVQKDDEHTSLEEKKDDKGWLYGMGIGLGALGAGVAKHEHDKKDEDYEIADDTPPEQETLEDD